MYMVSDERERESVERVQTSSLVVVIGSGSTTHYIHKYDIEYDSNDQSVSIYGIQKILYILWIIFINQ
jgi:hypothetical protein